MRTIYVILLGLILFQGVFIAISDSFPYSGGIKQNIDNPMQNETLAEYSPSSIDTIFIGLLTGAGIGGFIGGLGFLYFLGTKNYPAAGLCLFIGIILGLLVGSWQMISTINLTNNPTVTIFIDLIFLVIGIVSLFAVADMFAPQGAQQ